MSTDKQNVESELEAQVQKAKSIEIELAQQKQEVSLAKQSLKESEQNQAELKEKLELLEAKLEETAQSESQQPDKDTSTAASHVFRADIEELPTPENPTAFFDLNYFWGTQSEGTTLTSALQELLVRVEEVIDKGEKAVESEKAGELIMASQALMRLSRSINAEPLVDLAQSLENDCRQGLLDNALIRWYPTKQGLQKTLRVVYNQIQRI